MPNYNTSTHNQGNTGEGKPANVPARRYDPEDRIVPVRQPGRTASTREAIPYVNVPGEGETWDQLNQWRVTYGLPPVTR